MKTRNLLRKCTCKSELLKARRNGTFTACVLKMPFPGKYQRHVDVTFYICSCARFWHWRHFVLVGSGWPLVREKSGKFDFSSRSGKSQGILQIAQGNFKYQESRGKVREFIIWAQNMCCSRYFDYLKCEKSVDFFLSLAQSYENLLILEHYVARNYLKILFV